MSTDLPPAQPTARRCTLLLAMVAATLAACGTGPVAASGDVGDGRAADPDVSLAMTDNDFGPAEFIVAPDEPITLEVVNDGDTAHNLVIDALDVSTGTVEPASAAHVTVSVPPGGVDFQCTLHPGMAGRIATS